MTSREPLSLRVARLVALVFVAAACGCPSVDPDPTPAPGPDDDDDAMPSAPFTVRVEARVDGEPTAGVSVLQGGGDIQGTTEADGGYLLTMDPRVGYELWAVAALEGHRSVGVRVDQPTTDTLVIELTPIAPDNPDYVYGPPGVGGGETTEDCSHCHVRFTEQFGRSAHRDAASDPQVHDVFAGTASGFAGEGSCVDAGGRWLVGTRPGGGAGGRCYVGRGLLPDSGPDCGGPDQLACDDPDLPQEDRPAATGACADCHAPAIEGPAGGGHSLLDARGLAFEDGVHCDFCHKVAAVAPEAPAGVGGRLVMGRPSEPGGFVNANKPVMYGPYPDVLNPFMGGAWTPVFGTAEFCRGCHEYSQEPLWDAAETVLDPERWAGGALPVHSTWSEWAASPLAASTPCQGCHMPAVEAENSADLDLLEGLEPGLSTGFPRAPGAVRSHEFLGPRSETAAGARLVDSAAAVTVEHSVVDGRVEVAAGAANVGAGHAFPTGEPLRSAVLVVDATCGGASLEQVAGDVISAVGGAAASGVVGADVVVAGSRLTWAEGAAAAFGVAELEVRAVRDTGAWDDYAGVPPFDLGGFAPERKGRPVLEPLGVVSVVGGDASGLDLAEELPLLPGDRVTLAGIVRVPEEGSSPVGLAGLPGRDFARVMVDAEGRLQAPHYRAVDILRDDRILPGTSRTVSATFRLPEGCDDVDASATLVYRRYPLELLRARGWSAPEIVAASAP